MTENSRALVPGTQEGHNLGVVLNEWREFVWGADRVHPQIILKFPNDYGASIIPDIWSKTLIELAVVHFAPEGAEHGVSFQLDYDTPITYDVLRLTLAEMVETLRQIKDLPAYVPTPLQPQTPRLEDVS